MAKQRGVASGGPATTPGAVSSAAASSGQQLSQIEADIMAKQHGRSSRGPAAAPGAVSSSQQLT